MVFVRLLREPPIELAIGGFVLAIGGVWLLKIQRHREVRREQNEREAAVMRAETEHEIALDNQRETALQEYIDKMSELLLQEDLLGADPKREVLEIAKAQTITILRRLDADRKGSVLQFLYESGLIGKDNCIINLTGADLRGADLHDTNLQEANLQNANLSGADLSGANLTGASVTPEQLRRARSLVGTTMPDGTDHGKLLTREDVLRLHQQGGILHSRNLAGIDLHGADLHGADLHRANLEGADFRRADLRGADLGHAELSYADLSHAHLGGANLEGVILEGANLEGAVLIYAYLVGAKLDRANLRKANLSRAHLGGANLSKADLEEADLSEANLKGAKVTPEQLRKAKTLQGTIMPDGSKGRTPLTGGRAYSLLRRTASRVFGRRTHKLNDR